jgi:tetratricopeptide (TPR) repeat protein
LNKQGRICALQHKWKEAEAFFEKAIQEAQSVPDYYKQTESLIDLADTLEHLEQGERPQKLLQEAEDIATKENYLFLLGHIEKIRGQIDYGAGDYPMAFRHFVLHCHHMADYNFSEFSTAMQKVVDALLDVPKGEVPSLLEGLLTYWTTQQLNEKYPEFLQTFEEIHNLMVL